MKTILQIENMTRDELESLISKGQTQQSNGNEGKLAEKPLSSRELATRLDVTNQTLVRWRQQGLLPYYGHGKHIFHFWSEVVDALRQHPKLNK
ncbi:helix-turn-helix domain-containing protein [Perlabentimonas gracilis]|uniref:helix-turn-helix domain-containing protein n=1 Tax=Perlabentimonas gracilis TaxID=2715279 RepID=UPI00140A7FEF|nr:helix-turn-helix domain-containing protein [Perlabentimonas gracilis]NHB70309.1 helix-turn-helix domain-containing protein [Perlabentimonas gracilis]